MPSLSHLLLNFLELRPHAVASGFPFHLELSAAACSADEGEAQKIEGLRFSEPPMSAAHVERVTAPTPSTVIENWSSGLRPRPLRSDPIHLRSGAPALGCAWALPT